MTDPTDLPDDELISLVLDGAATSAQEARVAADPDLSARLEQFQWVAESLAVDPPPPAQVDAHLAAALDALEPPAAPGDEPADELAARRTRRWALPLSAAAAVLVGVLAIGVLADRDNGDDDVAMETADADVEAGAASVMADSEMAPIIQQLPFNTPDEVRDYVVSQRELGAFRATDNQLNAGAGEDPATTTAPFDGTEESTEADAAPGGTCDVLAVSGLGDEAPELDEPITYQDRNAQLLVRGDRLVVVWLDTCERAFETNVG